MKRNIFFIIFMCIANILISQRIKLFQLQQKGDPVRIGYFGLTNTDGNQVYVSFDSLVNSNHTWDLGANGSYTTISDAEQVNFVGAGIASTSRTGNQITITATETDGSTSNEIDNWDLGANGSYTTISNTEQVNFVGSGIVSTSRSFNTITVSATEVDGSNTNELQSWSNSGTTSYTGTLSSGGGGFSIVAGSNVTVSHSGGTVTISASSSGLTGSGSTYFLPVWTSSTNLSNSMFQQDAASGTYAGLGTAWVSGVKLTISTGDVKIGGNTAGLVNRLLFGDASFAWIGENGVDDRLYVYGTSLAIAAGGSYGTNGQFLTTNGTTDTWATLPDGSATNELQTWSNSGTTSYTGTLSSGGGGFSIVAGSNVTVSHSGGTVTISASGSGGSMSMSGGLVFTISGITGSMAYQAGSGISISNTGSSGNSNILITATDVSASNEIDTWDLGANGSYTTISNTEQVNFVGAGIVSTSRSTNTITITASEVDGSTSNEIDNWDLGANGSYTTISNTEQVNFVGTGSVTTSRSTNTITINGGPPEVTPGAYSGYKLIAVNIFDEIVVTPASYDITSGTLSSTQIWFELTGNATLPAYVSGSSGTIGKIMVLGNSTGSDITITAPSGAIFNQRSGLTTYTIASGKAVWVIYGPSGPYIIGG